AEAYGLPLNPGPFADSKKACCGFFFAQEKGRGAAYHDGVYRARWLEAGDIGQEETLAEVAERAGLVRAEFLAALREPHYEAALEGLARLEAVDEEVPEPTLLVALLEPAALRPEEARLADDLRHVLLLEPAEVALAAVGRDPDLHHVEDGRMHAPPVARPLET